MDFYLEADSILKSFNERIILSDIYLKCMSGDIIAIWGRNGSGKSTLFNILYGTMKADRLFLRINDKVITGKAYKTGQIVYLPQMNFLPKELIVEDLIRLVCGNSFHWLMDETIQKKYKSRIRDLSNGELRYIEILLLLENKSPFVILDEPFIGLSPIMVKQVSAYIKLNRLNKGIIFSDHNYQAAEKIANRYMLLNEGYLRPITDMEKLRGIYFR